MFNARTPRHSSTTTTSRRQRLAIRNASKISKRRKRSQDHYQRLEQRLPLTTFVVTTLADGPLDGSTDGMISLREAIESANTNSAVGDAPAGQADGDRIVFANGLFADDSKILLTEGELVIEEDLVIKGAIIDAQSASRVFSVLTNNELFSLRNSALSNGQADKGGLIFAKPGSNVVLFQSILRDSIADSGGAIYSRATNLLVVESSLFQNQANEHGGAIISIGEKATLLRSNFSSNQAQAGGAVSVVGGTLVSNSDFDSNRVDGKSIGGAINLGHLTTANIFGGSFDGNAALHERTGGGGAIASNGEAFYLSNAKFDNNDGSRGGTLAVARAETVLRNVEIKRGRADLAGGAASFRSLNRVSIFDSQFLNNSASDVGGGISIVDREDGGVFVVRNSTFSENYSESSSGGAISLHKTDARIFDTLISANSARQGAGIASDLGFVFMSNSHLTGNSAVSDGGGLFGSSEFHLFDSRISANSSTNGNGGGMYFVGDQYRRMFSTAVTGNSANIGGGVYVANGVLAAVESRFATNTSAREGGAAYVTATGRLNSRSTVFNSNGSDRGGAIFVRGIANLSDSTFTFNDADRTGGAATVAAEGRLLINSSSFLDNSSVGLGSAIEVADTSISLIDTSRFIGNASTADPTTDGDINVGDRVVFHKVINSIFSTS